MAKGTGYAWTIGILALLLGIGFTSMFFLMNPAVIEVEVPAQEDVAPIVEPEVPAIPEENETPAMPEDEGIVEVEEEPDWEELAWEQVLDEFEDDDDFYMCGGHEFDDDEYDYDIEEVTVKEHKNGDITVTLEVEFDFEDNSDERDCKVDRVFTVFWDEDDIEDEDWDEAEVTWVQPCKDCVVA